LTSKEVNLQTFNPITGVRSSISIRLHAFPVSFPVFELSDVPRAVVQRQFASTIGQATRERAIERVSKYCVRCWLGLHHTRSVGQTVWNHKAQ
jgi:hypothetical protein